MENITKSNSPLKEYWWGWATVHQGLAQGPCAVTIWVTAWTFTDDDVDDDDSFSHGIKQSLNEARVSPWVSSRKRKTVLYPRNNQLSSVKNFVSL